MKEEQENKKDISTENLTKALMGIVDVFHQEENDYYKELSKNVKVKEIENHNDFYRELVRPAEKFWGGFIRTEITKNNEMVFFLINSNFIENHFRYWIEKKEGSACSSDKSRAIMKRLYYWIKDEQKIIFDANEEYTYHHPKKVFTTHDEIDAFYLGLHHLHYGNPQQYLSIISELITK